MGEEWKANAPSNAGKSRSEPQRVNLDENYYCILATFRVGSAAGVENADDEEADDDTEAAPNEERTTSYAADNGGGDQCRRDQHQSRRT